MESEKVKGIKKALECCAECRCKDCPYEKGESVNPICIDILAQNALTLINELEREKELLRNAKVVYETVDYCYEDLKKAEKRIAELESENKEQLKQFAERLIEKKVKLGERFNIYDIDETLKEFVGVEQ